MDEAKEEIKARLPIEDVVGQYIELKRTGRTLKGRSPWGVDKTPSFMVSPEKGIWHDFSANKGGDVFSFVMEVEGIGFRDALEKLAAQAGVELKRYGGGDKKASQLKNRAKEALELSAKYYQFCLTKSKRVMDYVFYKRNLNKKTIEEFRIGYSPAGGKELQKFLISRGFKAEEINAAGLTNRFGGDMFRERMMVPFIDAFGDVIGYTARILGKGEPKYLNTSDTILFNKSRFIFGLYQAKEAIRRSGYVVIVEGNMDVISSHQAGVKEAVATSGTALTEQHLKILSRTTTDIRLAFDGDDAGVKATERAILIATKLGIKLSVISNFGDAKDPDELIQKDPELWRKAVLDARPAVDYLLEKYEDKFDLTTAEGKQEYWNAAKIVVDGLPGVMKKDYYKKVAKRLEVEVSDLETGDVATNVPMRRLRKAKTTVKSEKLEKIENNLLAIVLYGGFDEKGFEIEIPEDEMRLEELNLVFEHEYEKWGREALLAEFNELKRKWKEEKKKDEIEVLTAKMNDADEVEQKKLMEQIIAIRRG